ncbi:MAG: hypothetical protein IJN33_05300 [Phascolarctobacterium sp.]|nr:hypothetical protein [Phascolarctobacterium sp.]
MAKAEKNFTKIEKMQEFLTENKIECFEVQTLEDERHTSIFRSRMEVKGQILPMAILMDDSVYVLIQVQIAPQVITGEKLATMAEVINNMNNNVRLFKFTVSEKGDFMLNACMTAENNTFNPVLLNALLTETLHFLEAQYSNIMEVIWKKEA